MICLELLNTAEKSKDLLDDLVQKGELTVEQGKVLNEERKHAAKETIQKKVNPSSSPDKFLKSYDTKNRFSS